MARVPLVAADEFLTEKQSLLDTLADEDDVSDDRGHSLEGGTLNVYRALAHAPNLLEAFQTYGGSVWRESGLTPHERELVILATACAADSRYEWHQHVRVGLDEGLTPEQIRTVSNDSSDRFSPSHGALVEYVKAFVDDDVDEETYNQLAEHYDVDHIVAVGLLSGLYIGLARQLQALEVAPEVEFVGWNLENL